MTNQEIVDLLITTGHMAYPKGELNPYGDLQGTPPSEKSVKRAIESYQQFHATCLDPLCLQHHSRSLRCDGELGPATHELFDQPRCECPDYGRNVQAATGSGSWKGCHGIGDAHCAKAYIDKRNMPGFVKPYWDEMWDASVAAYDAIGLRWILTDDKSEANTVISWQTGRTGWIGLGIVGRGQSCGSQIWIKLSAAYHPSEVVRRCGGVLIHEKGHNCGLQHTGGGLMNAYSLDLPHTWHGDPSRPILVRKFGGKPVGGGGDDPEAWVMQGLKSNRGREVWSPMNPPRLIGEDD